MTVPNDIMIAAEQYGLPPEEACELEEVSPAVWERVYIGRILSLVDDGTAIEGTWRSRCDDLEAALNNQVGPSGDAAIDADATLAMAVYTSAGSLTEMKRRLMRVMLDMLREDGIIT
jgi:hypothetical protein